MFQGRIAEGEAVDEQLAKFNYKPSDIDYVLLSHLDCDHANGLRLVKDAKHILVSEAEMIGTTRKNLQIKIRFQKRWWEGVDLKTFYWNGTEGPVGKSYDVLGDGSLVMVNILGHSEGLCALKIRNTEGKYVLLFADGGYATKSWRDMITSGITLDKQMQRKSLQSSAPLWSGCASLSARICMNVRRANQTVISVAISHSETRLSQQL